MRTQGESLLGIDFVLLPMFPAVEKPVSVRSFKGQPRLMPDVQSSAEIQVALITSEGQKGIETRTPPVGRGQIDGMISLSDVERAAVDLNAFDRLRNKDVWVGISVAMRICRQIVRHQISADGDELRDRFAVIAGDAGRKVLRSFNSAGGGLDWISGNRNRRSGAAGIRVKQILADKHPFTRS